MKIAEHVKSAYEVVVRIDQGDYLQERGGHDWGRASKYEATTYGSVAEAEAAVDRLKIGDLAREIEDAE